MNFTNLDHPHEDTAASTEFGYRIRRRKQSLQKEVHARGERGLESLIAACIASGISSEPDIYAEVAGIIGCQYHDAVERLLMERMDISWAKNSFGDYVPFL